MTKSRFCLKLGLVMLAVFLSTPVLAQTEFGNWWVYPNPPVLELPENSKGTIVEFKFVDLVGAPVDITGMNPSITKIKGNDDDPFTASVLGSTSFTLEAGPDKAKTVQVMITPDKEVDDPLDKVGGLWNLNLRPTVIISGAPPGAIPPPGMSLDMTIHVFDVPEPGAMSLLSAIAVAFVIARRRRFRAIGQMRT